MKWLDTDIGYINSMVNRRSFTVYCSNLPFLFHSNAKWLTQMNIAVISFLLRCTRSTFFLTFLCCECLNNKFREILNTMSCIKVQHMTQLKSKFFILNIWRDIFPHFSFWVACYSSRNICTFLVFWAKNKYARNLTLTFLCLFQNYYLLLR